MTANTPNAARKRRPVGRPRGDGKPHLTRQRVFEVCTKLIAQHGFAGTSIRMMATALEASPASLFNLFGSKDGMLNELIAYAAQGSFAFYEALSEINATPEVLLYKSIYEEVIAVASADRDYVGIFYLPELRKPEFSSAQAVRATMISHYAQLIEQCSKGDVLDVGNVHLQAEQVFQLTETSILAPGLADMLSPTDQARQTAAFCMRAMGCSERELRSIAKAAAMIDLHIALPEA
ncbi:MAG: TetR/AcrR family transcriptional regulator [Pseudomonadota bacterium]